MKDESALLSIATQSKSQFMFIVITFYLLLLSLLQLSLSQISLRSRDCWHEWRTQQLQTQRLVLQSLIDSSQISFLICFLNLLLFFLIALCSWYNFHFNKSFRMTFVSVNFKLSFQHLSLIIVWAAIMIDSRSFHLIWESKKSLNW